MCSVLVRKMWDINQIEKQQQKTTCVSALQGLALLSVFFNSSTNKIVHRLLLLSSYFILLHLFPFFFFPANVLLNFKDRTFLFAFVPNLDRYACCQSLLYQH